MSCWAPCDCGWINSVELSSTELESRGERLVGLWFGAVFNAQSAAYNDVLYVRDKTARDAANEELEHIILEEEK